jgi:hypothetical protein
MEEDEAVRALAVVASPPALDSTLAFWEDDAISLSDAEDVFAEDRLAAAAEAAAAEAAVMRAIA